MSVVITEAKTDAERAVCMAIRMEVFVYEQGVKAEDEWDAYDRTGSHFLAKSEGKAVATARLRDSHGTAKIERVAVRAGYRQQHVGQALVEALLEIARTRGFTRATLSAQTYAVPFYEKIGFVAHGEEFIEAGIPHRAMHKPIE